MNDYRYATSCCDFVLVAINLSVQNLKQTL